MSQTLLPPEFKLSRTSSGELLSTHVLTRTDYSYCRPKRQLDTSGALALSDVDAGIHTAGNGVDLLDHLTDVAAKLKHLITGKRAEEGSGALALSDVDAGINTAGHGVDLVDHLTDLAGKLKHLFTGKRDLADVDAISQTVAQLLQRLHKQQQRRQTFVVPLGKTPPKSITRPIIIDGQKFRFNGLRSLADLD